MTYVKLCALLLMIVFVPQVGFAAQDKKEERETAIAEKKAELEQKKEEREAEIAAKKEERETAIAEKKAELEQKKEEREELKTERICDRLETTSANLYERIENLENGLSARYEEHAGKIADQKNAYMLRLEKGRAEADAKRASYYAKLDAQANTDAQKEAVDAYKQTVDAAVADRREKIDAITVAFWEEVAAYVDEEKTAYLADYEQLLAEVESAIDNAQEECSQSEDAQTVSKELRETLQALQKSFNEERKEYKGVRDGFGQLMSDFRMSVNDVRKEFQVVVSSAQEELRLAFGGAGLDMEEDEDGEDEDEDEEEDEE